MPSFIGHGVVGLAAGVWGSNFFKRISLKKLLLVSFLAGNFPDIDVIFHHLSLDHIEFLGHRNGFFHSVFFAFIAAPFLTIVFYRKEEVKIKIYLSCYFLFLILSHSLLDSMTKGIGVAFLYPFSNKEFLFPFTPLLPAGFTLGEFSQNMVIIRELLFIWFPCLVLIGWGFFKRKNS